jgi:hypothetical protein
MLECQEYYDDLVGQHNFELTRPVPPEQLRFQEVVKVVELMGRADLEKRSDCSLLSQTEPSPRGHPLRLLVTMSTNAGFVRIRSIRPSTPS